jgi:hypothetical protein
VSVEKLSGAEEKIWVSAIMISAPAWNAIDFY